MQAEAYFNEVFDTEQAYGAEGTPYAKYGFARIARAKGETEKARQIAQEVLGHLLHTVTSHKLLNEICDFLKSLEDVP